MLTRLGKEILALEKKRQRLQKKLNPCSDPGKVTVKLIFENNTQHNVEVYLVDSRGRIERFNLIVPPVSTKSIKRRLGLIHTLSGTESFVVAGVAYINKNWYVGGHRFTYKKTPKKKPCLTKYRWEILDRSLTAVPLEYRLWGVDAGPNLIIATQAEVANRTYKSFLNGGNDDVTKVRYWDLGGRAFSSIQEAQSFFCQMVQQYTHWNLYAPLPETLQIPRLYRRNRRLVLGLRGHNSGSCNSKCSLFRTARNSINILKVGSVPTFKVGTLPTFRIT